MIRSKAQESNVTTYAVTNSSNISLYFVTDSLLSNDSRKTQVKLLAKELMDMLEDEEILRGAKSWIK